MPVLTLTEVWVTLVATGDSIHAGSDPDRSREYSDVGEIRTYGEGRQRSVGSQGERGSFGFTLIDLSEDQLDTLRLWKKQQVQVRDHRGRRFYGTYFTLSIGEPKVFWPTSHYTASLVVGFTTYTEGV